MKTPFILVQDNLSTDTVRCLETLLHRAKSGEVIGLAFVAMVRQRNYVASAAGEARRNPTFAAGMLMALIIKLLVGQRNGWP